MRKLSESMWADAHKKNIGVEVRKENELSPFFGEDVKYRFYEKNDITHFTYEEALDIEKNNNGWRLPNEDDFHKLKMTKINDAVISQYGELVIPYKGCGEKDNRKKLWNRNIGYMYVKSNNSEDMFEFNDYNCALHRTFFDAGTIISVCLIKDR